MHLLWKIMCLQRRQLFPYKWIQYRNYSISPHVFNWRFIVCKWTGFVTWFKPSKQQIDPNSGAQDILWEGPNIDHLVWLGIWDCQKKCSHQTEQHYTLSVHMARLRFFFNESTSFLILFHLYGTSMVGCQILIVSVIHPQCYMIYEQPLNMTMLRLPYSYSLMGTN